MKILLRSRLGFTLILAITTACQSSTNILLRSQGANSSRELIGWQYEINKPYLCDVSGAFYLATEYSRTFNSKALAKSMFGTDTLTFSGSARPRNETDLLADNFGLPRDFQSTIQFNPLVQNAIIDFGFYLGLDNFTQGLYFRTHLPFCYTVWNIIGDFKEPKADTEAALVAAKTMTTTTPYAAGYVSQQIVTPVNDLKIALSGQSNYGDMKFPWNYGIFNFSNQKLGGLADIDLILGYNFINNDCGRFGLYLQAVMPTGNKPNGRVIFQPVIGNGKHFEFGMGISAMASLYQSNTNSLEFFLEGNITHMFSDTQNRVFDFKDDLPYGGYLSRYILFKGFINSTYNAELQNGVNLTSRQVNVTIPVKADFSLKFSYRHCGFQIDLGYNVYGQSAEQLSLCSNYPGLKSGVSSLFWAPKGAEDSYSISYSVIQDNAIQGVAGKSLLYNAATQTHPGTCALQDNQANLPFPPVGGIYTTSLAQGNNNARFDAKINSVGTVQKLNNNLINTANSCSAAFSVYNQQMNLNVFTPVDMIPAESVLTTLFTSTQTINATQLNENLIFRPADNDKLNLSSGAAPAIFTQKIFTHVNYVWENTCGLNPYLGVGAEAEFSPCSNNNCRLNYNVWGIWLKTGFSF